MLGRQHTDPAVVVQSITFWTAGSWHRAFDRAVYQPLITCRPVGM